ncbi:calmodulin-dependent cyclic-nucleotide phosphodiesterase [Aureococcus anophagefferens]|nr:calmodulin-dependent cyclic-nucleotide phosphodiesterase [Aureococcus anophagefferens]
MFSISLCGADDGVDESVDCFESDDVEDDTPRSHMAELALRARVNRRLRSATPGARATLTLSPGEVHVLRLLTEPSGDHVARADVKATDKSSEDFFDRLRNQGAIKKVIQTNRFRSALGPPDRLPKDLGEAQRTQIRAAFARVDGWDFDLWAVSDAVAGDGKLAARVVAEEIILERRRVAATRSPDFCALLRAFFASVLDRYERVPYGARKRVPYHGALHGADVLQSAHALLIQNEAFDGSLNEDTILVVLVAALAHDVGHPGLTNAFLVETQHELAVRYNDHSPLENMHSRVALDLARPWLATLDADARKRARSTWIELVLATDMKEHAAAIFQVEHALSKDPAYDARAVANHTTCLKLLIHAADLSNPTKAWATYDRWTAKIMEEFYAQADREAELDLPRTVPPRGQCEMDKFQLGFIGFIRPLFVAASKIRHLDMRPQVEGLDAVARVWQDKAKAADEPQPADEARPPPEPTCDPPGYRREGAPPAGKPEPAAPPPAPEPEPGAVVRERDD